MLRGWSLWTAFLLALALALVAVPVTLQLAPAVVSAFDEPQPVPTPPQIQLPPDSLTPLSIVQDLDPEAPIPDPAVLRKLLAPELTFAGPGEISGVVLDAETGGTLFDQSGTKPQMPASNLKLLTAVAVMAHVDPEERLHTSVLQGPQPDSLVLRAGGDVLLTASDSRPDAVVGHAGLQTLANETVARLDPADGPFRVSLDDTLFTGAALNPGWLQGDVASGQIAPIHSLAINSAWEEEGKRSGPRSQDAALDAAAAFRSALDRAGAAHGIEVAQGVERQTVPEDAVRLATVESAPVGEQVAHMLRTSDNYLAEALARLGALKSGRAASSDGAAENILQVLQSHGVDAKGMVVGDASGLSPHTRVSPAQLAALVRAMVRSERPGMASILEGMPVAGLSGTLDDRYDDGEEAAAAAGLVRAKTGTLNAVTALSGYVVSSDGRLLVFSFIAGGLEGNLEQARTAVDNAAAVLAGCGCG